MNFNDWKNPNSVIVKHFANAFDISYLRIEEELKNLFSEQDVLSKEVITARVKTLNAHYHTRLYRDTTDKVVNYLVREGMELERKLRDVRHPDYTIAGDIAFCEIHHCFVFATKYCSFINSEVYPICDSLICRVLNFFQKRDEFYKDRYLKLGEVREAADYRKFVGILDSFRNKYGLESCSYREIDKYLWLVGANVKSFKDEG